LVADDVIIFSRRGQNSPTLQIVHIVTPLVKKSHRA
jgi:hypothetical protein